MNEGFGLHRTHCNLIHQPTVYTTVLTNGQRVVKPSAPTRFARAVPHIEGNWATHIYIRGPCLPLLIFDIPGVIVDPR